MSDKTTLLREADEAFAELRQAIDGLGEAPMRQVWLGTWGVREILIHISGWHRAMVPALGTSRRVSRPTRWAPTTISTPGTRASSSSNPA